MTRTEVFARINEARHFADIKHGQDTLANIAKNNPHMANTILVEEVGEVARAILEHDDKSLVAELIDILQVCTAWLESM